MKPEGAGGTRMFAGGGRPAVSSQTRRWRRINGVGGRSNLDVEAQALVVGTELDDRRRPLDAHRAADFQEAGGRRPG